MHRHLKLQLPHLKPHDHSDGSMHVHMYERTDLWHSASSLAVMVFRSGESVFVCLFFHKTAHCMGMTLSINIEVVLLRLSTFSFCSSLPSDISKTRLCILLARKKIVQKVKGNIGCVTHSWIMFKRACVCVYLCASCHVPVYPSVCLPLQQQSSS